MQNCGCSRPGGKAISDKQIYLDFEFCQVSEPKVKLVSCATFDIKSGRQRNFWLHNSPPNQRNLVEYLKKFEIITGYACVAEARSFLALGLNPLDFKWIDLFLEYRMMTNHNDSLQWGQQLVDGKVKNVRKPKPKYERTEEDQKTGFKATHSLAEATFKLTGAIRDTEHKEEMRRLIISDPKKFSDGERRAILDYGAKDVIHLPEIWTRLKEEFGKLAPEEKMQNYFMEAIDRGRYSAHTAIMEATGYPINVEATRNFSKQIPNILMDCQRDINAQFPEQKPFKWNKKTGKFTWDQKITRGWVSENNDEKKWMRTDGGQLSLALEAFEKFHSYKHDYPRGKFGAQMVRFLKLKQSLYGFSDSGGKRKNFWDSVGSDGRVRPYMNIYGAQSGRSQPAASGFIFLKPAWMRALVQPKRGKFIAGVDYGQQEFFIAALESDDSRMIEAYLSGDPYLHTAKLCRAIPWDGKREDYKDVRELFKNTTLGISYLMTKYGLAIKLTNDTGEIWTEDEAQEQIDAFNDAYPDHDDYQEELMELYQDGGAIRLPCIAEGVKVLTKSGNKNIEDINKNDLIWDGYKWINHGGIVQKGAKAVMKDPGGGLIATPDHLIFHRGRWCVWLEVLEDEKDIMPQKSISFLEDGKLLARRQKSEVVEMSFVAAYVELKKTLELIHCSLEPLEPVLFALNLSDPRIKDAGALAQYLLTSIFGDAGKIVIAMQNVDAKIAVVQTLNGMALAAYNFPSNRFEISWNTLLLWMAIQNGESHWTELIMTETMSPETYELLLTQKTMLIKETFDIVDCGPFNQFQAENRIVHNCGWRFWCDNDNLRSVCNVPIQGFGASVMRKAVDLAVGRGCSVIFTLHDAIYIEGNIGRERDIAILMDSMREAFQFYYKGTRYYEIAGKIKLDPFAWSPNYGRDSEFKIMGKHEFINVPCSNLYIDERAISEYERFSKYFSGNDADLL